MKKIISLLLLSLFIIPNAFAYRDVPQNSSLYPAVEWMLESGYYQDGSFFRPDSPVPADLFWQVSTQFAGFNPDSAEFNTILPEGVSENAAIAQYLREAVRRGFLSNKKPYDSQATISRLEAIRVFLKMKAVLEPDRVSDDFKKIAGDFAPGFRGARAFEAGMASGFLTESDVRDLRPHFPLTRREFVQWLYNYSQNGSKASSLDPDYRPRRKQTPVKFNYQERLETPDEDRGEPIRPSFNRPTRKSEDEMQTIRITTGGGDSYELDVQDVIDRRLPEEETLREVYQRILQKYRFQSELTDEKKKEIMNAAIAGMVKALDDKYSSYIVPDKSEEFEESLSGNFEGIGAYVEMIEDYFTITAPIKGSPAEKAGLLPGDIVVEVDGEEIKGLTVNEIVRKIKGPAGTEVDLKIRREGGSRDYTVVRGKITIPSITIEFKNSIPVIGINQFSRTTASDFGRVLTTEVLPKNPRGIVLDLRNNPGGFLTSAVDMGEYFLKKDDLIFNVDQRTVNKKYVSSRDGELSDFKGKVVVLVNKGTASASEILAGMLQDYEKATIIGSKTVGKGTVQEVIPYQNGGALKITVAKWLTPNGRWIQEDEENMGIQPDIVMEDQTPEERRANIDKPLDRALNTVLGR